MLRSSLSLILLLASCTGGSPPATTGRTGAPTIKALSAPAAWLVSRIGGDRVVVENILPAGESADTWSPPGEVVAGLSDADLIVANGAGYEAWTQTATLPTARLVDSARGLDLIAVDGRTHSHGKAGEHSHSDVDPHTWTDPAAYAHQAGVVHAALVRLDPEGKAVYDANLSTLQADLTKLGAELDAALAPARGRAMISNHPSFSYLARRARLDLRTIDMDPLVAPEPGLLGTDPVPGLVIWWESAPTDAVRASLPAGLVHLVVDPLEQPAAGGSYDYLAQARGNVAQFRATFPAAGGAP
jgi:zinc transport system substrate-binding protein